MTKISLILTCWNKGAITEVAKIILPVSVRISAILFFCFSLSTNIRFPSYSQSQLQLYSISKLELCQC